MQNPVIRKPNMISDAISFMQKHKGWAIAFFIWIALLCFFSGTILSNVDSYFSNKKVTHKVGYCITYMGGERDTLRYEFKGKENVPFESYLTLNSNGCVSNYNNVIIACGVRKVEWLFTGTYHEIKKK